MEPKIAEVIDSWLIANLGPIVDLKHFLDGLPQGSVLSSPTSGKRWLLKYRILHSHIAGQQRRFQNENANIMRPSFSSIDHMQQSAERILETEAQNIFQYLLQGIDHNSKPEKGELLFVSYSQ